MTTEQNKLKGKIATLKEDFYTDDECSCGVLIKKGSKVYIKGNENDGTCYVEYLDFGFSISATNLNIPTETEFLNFKNNI